MCECVQFDQALRGSGMLLDSTDEGSELKNVFIRQAVVQQTSGSEWKALLARDASLSPQFAVLVW